MENDYKSPKKFDPDHGYFEIKIAQVSILFKKFTRGPENKCFWTKNVGVAGKKGDEN